MTSRQARRARLTAPTTRPEVNLDIGEVVLHGFDARDRTAIGDVFGARLAELLGGGPPPFGADADARWDRLQLGDVSVTRGATPADVGERIAAAVAEGLAAAGHRERR
jgi:hypothetical protein